MTSQPVACEWRHYRGWLFDIAPCTPRCKSNRLKCGLVPLSATLIRLEWRWWRRCADSRSSPWLLCSRYPDYTSHRRRLEYTAYMTSQHQLGLLVMTSSVCMFDVFVAIQRAALLRVVSFIHSFRYFIFKCIQNISEVSTLYWSMGIHYLSFLTFRASI